MYVFICVPVALCASEILHDVSFVDRFVPLGGRNLVDVEMMLHTGVVKDAK